MRSNRPTIADPEIRFRTFRNISSDRLARGTSVYFSTVGDASAGDSPNGISVHLCPSSSRGVSLWAGIVYPETGIPAGDYGECQVSGWCDYALVLRSVTDQIDIGEFLQGAPNQPYLVRFPSGLFSRVVLMETITVGTAVAAGRRVLLFGVA